jgi:C-terminal processing protease CtpA/Prc
MTVHPKSKSAKRLALSVALVGSLITYQDHAAFAQQSPQGSTTQQQQQEQTQPQRRTEPSPTGQRSQTRQQASDPRQQGREQPQAQRGRDAVDPHAEDESPALGVVVGACPGDAVCVLDTIWGSPADTAGLRQGDYILSVNNKRVTSPLELNKMMEQLGEDQELTLIVWRNGQQSEKKLRAATIGENEPPSHKAWLGVMLRPAAEKGVEVHQVVRNSPASEAGLRTGDRIVKVDDKDVMDAKSFVQCVEDKGPDDEMQLTVMRGDNEQQVSVTLGSLDEAPMQFLRQARQPMDAQRSESYGSNQTDEVLEETIDELREQIRELRQQIQEMTGGQQKADKDKDLSFLPLTSDDEETLIVQRGSDRRNWNRNRRSDSNYYDWNNRYRSNYRSPLYRSPRYGNYYYQYGGQPYYRNYGNRGYGYGMGRPGLQFGNLGVYWY